MVQAHRELRGASPLPAVSSALNKIVHPHRRLARFVEPNHGEAASRKDFIFLNVQKKKVKILFSDIVYIESQREYIRIVTTKKEYVSKMSTHEIESLLPDDLFKRIHRSFIVSIGKVESYTAEAVEVNGVSIPIGRDYRGVIEKF